MLERREVLLKILCATLTVVLVAEVARVVLRRGPLTAATIPAVPTLSATTNTPVAVAGHPSAPGRTGPAPQPASSPTNAPGAAAPPHLPQAALVAKGTNAPLTTNAVAPQAIAAKGTNASPATNAAAPQAAATGTNALNPQAPLPAPSEPATTPAASLPPGLPPGVILAGGPPGMGGPVPAPALPAEVQARITRITDSEVLAPANKPPPMALLGIAGHDVFLRTATGQAGLVKLGDELDGVKILKIGVNRVLVEDHGEKKELTIFEGFGGESLLPNQPAN